MIVWFYNDGVLCEKPQFFSLAEFRRKQWIVSLAISSPSLTNPRQAALLALRAVARGAYADAALEQAFGRSQLTPADRHLATELIYGTVRQRRTLDAIIDRLLRKSEKAGSELRSILQIGLYQLRHMDRIPVSAAVDTTVQLAKENRLEGLAALVNGVLRQYLRQQADFSGDWCAGLEQIARIGTLYSFPDWLIGEWLPLLGEPATIELCQIFNRPPPIDLRVNTLRTNRSTVLTALQAAHIDASPLPHSTEGIRLTGPAGAIPNLPGYQEAWWTVQESSAQLVGQLLYPQAGEVVVDACAAPGGKTTHLAELMGDNGTIYAIDPTASRLRKVTQNCERMALKSVQTILGDSRQQPDLEGRVDRVLLDAPCSGLGTLHRRADARWHKTPDTVRELALLQEELLNACARWVKPGGVLVYATCTIHPAENEDVIRPFLETHPAWRIDRPQGLLAPLASSEGWITTWPQEHQTDGFFMVRMVKNFLE
jgi:16S rRNA (cytosine967-C5)-methyltransferase